MGGQWQLATRHHSSPQAQACPCPCLSVEPPQASYTRPSRLRPGTSGPRSTASTPARALCVCRLFWTRRPLRTTRQISTRNTRRFARSTHCIGVSLHAFGAIVQGCMHACMWLPCRKHTAVVVIHRPPSIVCRCLCLHPSHIHGGSSNRTVQRDVIDPLFSPLSICCMLYLLCRHRYLDSQGERSYRAIDAARAKGKAIDFAAEPCPTPKKLGVHVVEESLEDLIPCVSPSPSRVPVLTRLPLCPVLVAVCPPPSLHLQ